MLAAIQHFDEGGPAGSVLPPFLNMMRATPHIGAYMMGMWDVVQTAWEAGIREAGAGVVAPASPAREDIAEEGVGRSLRPRARTTVRGRRRTRLCA